MVTEVIQEADVKVERWRFSSEDYHKMVEVGILTEDDPVELIDGELIRMSAAGGKHVETVSKLTRLAVRAAGDEWLVSVQSPISIPERGEPEPDMSVVRDRPYGGKLPGPEDICLVIEVSDSSLAYDQKIKLPMYAAAGIPES